MSMADTEYSGLRDAVIPAGSRAGIFPYVLVK